MRDGEILPKAALAPVRQICSSSGISHSTSPTPRSSADLHQECVSPHCKDTCTDIHLCIHIPVITSGAVSCPRLTSLESREVGERLRRDPATALVESCYLGQELFTTLEAQVNYNFSEAVEAKVLKTAWLIITHIWPWNVLAALPRFPARGSCCSRSQSACSPAALRKQPLTGESSVLD